MFRRPNKKEQPNQRRRKGFRFVAPWRKKEPVKPADPISVFRLVSQSTRPTSTATYGATTVVLMLTLIYLWQRRRSTSRSRSSNSPTAKIYKSPLQPTLERMTSIEVHDVFTTIVDEDDIRPSHSSRVGKPLRSIAITCQPVGDSALAPSLSRHHSITIVRPGSLDFSELLTGADRDLDESSHHSINSSGSTHLSLRNARSNSIVSCCSCDSFSTLGTHDDAAPAYVMIYFATQTGTSAYYASQLLREGQGMGFDISVKPVKSLADAMIENPTEEALRKLLIPHITKSGKERGRAVFLVSTYHDGGPTDDAKDFVEIISRLQSKKCLKGLRYSVVGFGDSSFTHSYNMQGQHYDRLLNDLGGKRIAPAGYIDAKKDVEYNFDSWKWKVFWPKFADLSAKDCQIFSKKDSGEESEEAAKKLKSSMKRKSLLGPSAVGPSSRDFDLVIVEANKTRQCHDGGLGKIHPGSCHLIKGVDCHVKSISTLWKSPDTHEPGSVMHIEFDLALSEALGSLKYSTGDNFAVLPVNPVCLVEAVAQHLDYTLDTTFMLTPKDDKDVSEFLPKVPTPCTVQEYLSLYAELGMPPRRDVVRTLSKFATDAKEREELYLLSAKKNNNHFKAKFVKEHIGLGEIISKYYPSIRIPLERFIDLCATLQPRWYSASSSSLVNPNTLCTTFSVVSFPRLIDDSTWSGICSNYMANLQVGDTVRIMRLSSSGLVTPSNPQSPLIMIANGTGIAPMRGLCQERHYQKTVLMKSVGPTELFFGIRCRDADFLYQAEFMTYLQSGSMTKLHLACSREQQNKIHVQHLVKENEDHIWELLDQGGHIYICGANAMGSDIEIFLKELISQKIGHDKVNAYMELLESTGRYIREGWTSKIDPM